MDFTAEKYAKVIADNIMSGNNACGTLLAAVERQDAAYFVTMALPVVETLLQQLSQEQSLRTELSVKNESLRFALELLVQNMTSTPNDPATLLVRKTDDTQKAVETALGRALPM